MDVMRQVADVRKSKDLKSLNSQLSSTANRRTIVEDMVISDHSQPAGYIFDESKGYATPVQPDYPARGRVPNE